MNYPIYYEVSQFKAEHLFNALGYVKSLDDDEMLIYIKANKANLIKRIMFSKSLKAFNVSCIDINGTSVCDGTVSEDELQAIIRQFYDFKWTAKF